MSLKHFDRSLIFIALCGSCGPYIRFAVFAAANHILRIVAERRVYLTAGVLISSKFDLETFISEVVHPHSRIITRDQEFDVAVGIVRGVIDGLDASDFAPLGIFAMRRSHMKLRVILQSLGFVEKTQAVQTPGDCSLSIRGKSHSGDEIGKLVPKSDAFVWYAP